MTAFLLPHTLPAWLAASLVASLVGATIKGSIVIILVGTLQLVIGRRVQARWRHALWLLVLVRLLVPAAPSSRWSLFNLFPMSATVQPPLRIDAAAAPEVTVMPIMARSGNIRFMRIGPGTVPAVRWLLGIWFTGVLLLTLRTAIASLRMRLAVQRAWKSWRSGGQALPSRYAALRFLEGRAVDGACPPRLRSALGRMRILESGIVRTPALHGLITPTLLLPRGMSDAFTPEELRHVVLHELWHVRRLDVAVNWLLSIVQTIHWFNPFVWFATSRIKEERELACDELTLSCLEEEERFSYGTTILKLLERFRAAAPVPALVGIVDHKQKMKRRLTMITSYRSGGRFPAAFIAVLAVVSAVAFTDARGGEHQFVKKLDPAAAAAIESLQQRVTLDLTNATFSELLSAVGGGARVAVTQSADVATSTIQQARFTLKAENVPAHAVLMEALAPFALSAEPTANGVTVTSQPQEAMQFVHGPLLLESSSDKTAEKSTQRVERVIVLNHEHTAGSADSHLPAIESERSGDALPGERRIFVHKMGHGDAKLDADGKTHRELTINIDENGVKSEGKLSLDITAPPPVK